jgi:isopentenyldiphosphate isomerase
VTGAPGDELVDIVDDDDRVVATVTRARMRAEGLLHRAVSIAVFGSDGRLLVHRRAETKDLWPGMWDIAAGGVVGAGESYLHAARREVAEELGIEPTDLELLGKARYADESVQLVGCGYRCVHDGPFTFTDGEIAEVRWVDRAGLDVLMAAEHFVPDSQRLLLPLLHLD